MHVRDAAARDHAAVRRRGRVPVDPDLTSGNGRSSEPIRRSGRRPAQLRCARSSGRAHGGEGLLVVPGGQGLRRVGWWGRPVDGGVRTGMGPDGRGCEPASQRSGPRRPGARNPLRRGARGPANATARQRAARDGDRRRAAPMGAHARSQAVARALRLGAARHGRSGRLSPWLSSPTAGRRGPPRRGAGLVGRDEHTGRRRRRYRLGRPAAGWDPMLLRRRLNRFIELADPFE